MKQFFLIACLLLTCCAAVPHLWAQSLPSDLVPGISRAAEKIEQAQQAVEDAAGRTGLQRAAGTLSAKQDRQLRSNAQALDNQLNSLNGVMKDIGLALERSARHDLLAKHRERTAELEERLEQIRGSLAADAQGRLSENGLPFGRVAMQREREERIYKRDDESPGKPVLAPGALLGPTVEPLRRATQEIFDPDVGEALLLSGKAFALAREQDVFHLVSFEREKTFENTAPGPDGVHEAVRFDLDLPLGARPLRVAGLGELQGLVSQAVLQAISLPVEQDSEPDGRSVIITPEIAALAEELGKNPVRIYEYVKNTVMYQPYWGALKGAAETLAQKSGNDADQASLLIALLRASGYAARYGRALVTVDIERAKQWLGVEDDTCVDWMFASAGVPGTTALVDQAGKIRAVRFEHIFVEAYLPYADYRGSSESTRHKLWVPLAPAFKKRLDVAGMDITELVDFDVEALADYLEAHVKKNSDGSYTGFDTAWLQEQIADYVRRVREYLVSEGITLRDLIGYEEIIPQKMEILPITLPFTSTNTTVFSALPDDLHYHVRVRLADHRGIELAEAEGRLLIDWQTSFVELTSQRLTLSWQADTEEDITQMPAYLVDMTPQIRLAGAVAAQGPQRMLGSEAVLRVQIVSPNAQFALAHAYDYRLSAGDYTAIVPVIDGVTGEHLMRSAGRLQEAVDARIGERDPLVGEYLYLTGMLYHFRLGLSEKQTARLNRVHHFRKPSALICNAHLDMLRVDGDFPLSIKGYRLIFDFGNNYFMVIPKTADLESRLRCIQAIGPEMSALEHVVLQEMFLSEAVSAVKLLELANEQGVPIYDITPDNRAGLLPKLDLPAEDIALIERELDRNQRVTVTKTRLRAGTYNGAPIISLPFDESDPYASVRMGYFISGPANGAELYDMVKDWLTKKGYGGWFDYAVNKKNVIQNIVTDSDEIAKLGNYIGGYIYEACTTVWKQRFSWGFVTVTSLNRSVFWRYVGLGSLIIRIDFRAGDDSNERMEQGEDVEKDNVYLKGEEKEAFYKIISMYGGEPYGVTLSAPEVKGPESGWSHEYPLQEFYFTDDVKKHASELEVELELRYISDICLREYNISKTRGIYYTCGIKDLFLENEDGSEIDRLTSGMAATARIDDVGEDEGAEDILWEHTTKPTSPDKPVLVELLNERGPICEIEADPDTGAGELCISASSTHFEMEGKCQQEKCFFVNCPIEGIEIVKSEKYPVPVGSTAEFEAKLTEGTDENIELEWEVLDVFPKDEKCPLRVDIEWEGTRAWLTVDETSGTGEVDVVVRIPGSDVCLLKKRIEIGCACEECDTPGSAQSGLDSVNVQFGLGKAGSGIPAGHLFLQALKITPELAMPQALVFSSLSSDVEALYDRGGVRQIIAPQTFVDIQTYASSAYEVRFFAPAAQGTKDGRFYRVVSGSEPFVTWRVQYLDNETDSLRSLRITETRNNSSSVREYTFDNETNTMELSQGDGLQIKSLSEHRDNETGIVTAIESIRDSSGVIASKTRIIYQIFPWGRAEIERVEDPDGAALTTLTGYYPALPGKPGNIKYKIQPDGSWAHYSYDELGRVISETRGLEDTPYSENASQSQVSTISYDYEPVDPSDSQHMRYKRSARTVIERHAGIVTAKTYNAYISFADSSRIEITERCAAHNSAYGDPANERTVREYYPNSDQARADAGRIKSQRVADGRLTIYTYEYGAFVPGADPAQSRFTPDSGQDIRQSAVHGTLDHPAGIAYKTTKDVRIENRLGQTVFEQTFVYTGSGHELIAWTAHEYDRDGHPVKTRSSDGTMSESVWGCCGRESDTDSRGIQRTFAYDALRRVTTEIHHGASGQDDIVNSYSYDAVGRRLESTVSAGDLSQSTLSDYDMSGRIFRTTGPDGLVTNYSYDGGGRVSTATRPGGSTEITERYLDGRIKSVAGTGVIHRFYEYGVKPDGTQWTTVYTKDSDSPMWEKTITDMLGRSVRTEKPGFGGTVEVSEHFYNNKGKLVKTTSPGLAATLYAYDELGNQVMSGLDVEGNNVLAPASGDRITAATSLYVSYDDVWWQKSEQQVYAAENSSAATIVSTQLSRLTGLGAGGLVSENVSIDTHGNRVVSRNVINRSAGTETATVDYPDSTIDAVSFSVNGLLMSSIDKSGIETTFVYDALGRRVGLTDPRTGTNTTGYTPQGWVAWVQDAAGNRTVYGYNAQTGEKISEINPDNTTMRYSYNNQGQITHQWGSSTYPVSYEYDGYGRLARMLTYRDGSGFEGETFPGGASGDETLWIFDEPSGLLAAKQDAEGKQVTYTYAEGGRLQTRIWAREGGTILTTYNYDPTTGELVSIDYSDATPDVGFSYDRLGRQKTVSDAVGSRTFAYNSALQLESEAMTGLISETITRQYDTLGRSAGFVAGDDYSITYAYDAIGRFNNVGWTADKLSGNADYAYLPNSDLLQSMTTASGLATTYSYEPHRNLRTQIKNKYNTSTISQYDYAYDSLGRRASVQNSGSALAQAAFNIYDYNNRSELTGSSRYNGTDITDVTNPVNPEARTYQYDNIGNRESATEALTKQITYEPNPLNQYTQITTDAGTPVTGDLHYDDDGNLIAGIVGCAVRTALTYDAENRLISVEPQTPAPGTRKVEFTYDYMSRRVQKQVFDYTGGSWAAAADTRFLYDGWNLIREVSIPTLDPGPQTFVLYVWGLDLSGTLQGAGGIGGLLSRINGGTSSTSSVFLYTYDGNGNVGQLVDTDGIIAAHYEYDPFGNTITSHGLLAEANPYRFSTKYLDVETRLYYYGYRYYSAGLGRWLGRDSIGEDGGLNLYGFVGNSPIGLIDPDGHDFIAVAKRPLDLLPWEESRHVGINIHTSIEYWECPCPVGTDKEHKKSDIKSLCKKQDFKESVEVLGKTWWIWEKVEPYSTEWPPDPPYWTQSKVGVSVVVYNDTTNTGKTVMAFYEPNAKDMKQNTINVQTEWGKIIGRAQQYDFAEQENFGGNFQKWPDSNYNSFGNNCHTFSKSMVSPHRFPDILGHMVGNDFPKKVKDKWGGRKPVLTKALLGTHP